MKENAELVEAHHSEECITGIRRDGNSGHGGGQRSKQSNHAQRPSAGFGREQRISHHHHHTDDGENKFRENAKIIAGLNGTHWPESPEVPGFSLTEFAACETARRFAAFTIASEG